MSELEPAELAANVRAQGVAFALIGALFERKGLLKTGELARMMSLLARVTHEEDPMAGDILATWAFACGQIASMPFTDGHTDPTGDHLRLVD